MYVLRRMRDVHTDEVKLLWRDRLDAPETYIDQWIDGVLGDSQTTGVVAVSTENGSVFGAGIACIADEEYVSDYLNHPGASVPVWPVTGIIHTLVVDKEHERNGIGTAIVESELDWLKDADCEGAVAVSWHRNGMHDSRPLFQKLGFEQAFVDESFFENAADSVHCTDCAGACECGGTVFTIEL